MREERHFYFRRSSSFEIFFQSTQKNQYFVNEKLLLDDHLLCKFSHMPDCFLVGIKSKCSEGKNQNHMIKSIRLISNNFLCTFFTISCICLKKQKMTHGCEARFMKINFLFRNINIMIKSLMTYIIACITWYIFRIGRNFCTSL